MAIEQGLIAIGAGLAIGMSALAAAIAEKEIGVAAIGASAEKESFFAKGLILTVIPETIVIFGLVVAIMIIGMAALNMSLEKVKQTVIAEATEKAKAITDEAQAEAQRIKKNAQASQQVMQKQIQEEATQLERAAVEKALSAAELEKQKRLLALKKSLIDDVFAKAEEKISKRADAQRKKDVQQLVKRAQADLDVAHVITNKKDSAFVSGADVKNQDMLGGIIAENKQGTVRIDYRYEGMLDSLRDELGAELSELLFK